MQADEWFRAEIATGLQKLLALRLPGTPPEDAIVGTAQVWLEALWPDRAWVESLDRERMRHAFRALFRLCERWPSPRLFLDNLGSRAQPVALSFPAISPQERARHRTRLNELVQTLKQTFTRKEAEHGNWNENEDKSRPLRLSDQGANDRSNQGAR